MGVSVTRTIFVIYRFVCCIIKKKTNEAMILKGLWAYNIFVSLVATREVLPYTANE